MCLFTLRSTDNKDGTIQQDDPPTSCKDGSQDFNIRQFSSTEEHEREASTSYIKTPCSIRKKLEAAINLDRSLNADAVEDEDLGELRATLESADDNLKTQMLQNETNNLKEDHPKLEMKKDKMCLKTSSAQGEIQQENQFTPCRDCCTDIHVRHFFVNYQNEDCTNQHNALQHPSAISKHAYTYSTAVKNAFSLPLKFSSRAWTNIKGKSRRELMKMILEDTLEITEYMIEAAGEMFSKKLKAAKEEIERIVEEEKKKIERIILEELKEKEREIKEYIRMLFVMLLLAMLIKSISQNFQCRQTSCRKYPCLNSILYLLWKSGDIEVNPGPANSTTYRNWLYQICSIVRKAIAGVPAECKMFNIWKKKPDNWPSGELYSDPKNTKGMTVNKVENFLLILLNCCDTNNLSREIKYEIDTWKSHRSKDNGQLLHLYRMRECLKSVEQVDRSLKVLRRNVIVGEILRVEADTCTIIYIYCQPTPDQQLITNTIYRSKATRKIAAILWKILHGKDPEKKYDFIWTQKPDWWPLNVSFYDPNNGGKRCAENDREDAMLVNTIITKCKDNEIKLQKPYKDIVDAWEADDKTLLSNLMTRHTAETDLKRAVMKLHEEGLLQDSDVDKQLRELGLFVQCESKAKKRKMANKMYKHETKRTKQRDNEGAGDTSPNELLPDCFLGELLRNNSQDDPLPDMIRKYLPDSLNGAFDDIQC